ncbi:MAG: hypothetical protein AAGF93_00070 [Cyanobacteria bacterium P01_H01_bin.105]
MSTPIREVSIEFKSELDITLTEDFDYEAALKLAKGYCFDFDDAECFMDLTEEDQLAVLRIWVIDNIAPGVYYQDYSGKHPMICLGSVLDDVEHHSFEVYEIDLDDQPELGALQYE